MLSKDIQRVLKPCLWGTAIDSLDIEKDKFLIIERLLEHGGDNYVDFITKTYDTESISKVVINSAYLGIKTVK